MTFLIIGIVMFMLLVLAHEFGHFFASKKLGVKVLEFGIGLPPKLAKIWKDKSGTEYTVNAIPLGGFCALKGEDPSKKEEFYAEDSFFMAKFWKKVIIILAGVFVNFLLAWLIFTGLFWHGTMPLSISPMEGSTSYLMPSLSFLKEEGFATGEILSGIIVTEVVSGSNAENIGLLSGDIILEINGSGVTQENVHALLASGVNQANTLLYQTLDDQQILSEFSCEDTCILGVVSLPNSTLEVSPIKFGFMGAMGAAFHEIGAEWNLTMKALGKLVQGLFSFNSEGVKGALKSVAGPVGAIKMGEMFYTMGGRSAYLAFAAIISLALAIFNILPIPALDGGRLLGLCIQKGFKIPLEKYTVVEGWVNMIIFWLLLAFGIVIIFKDLIVFWGVQIPFFS